MNTSYVEGSLEKEKRRRVSQRSQSLTREFVQKYEIVLLDSFRKSYNENERRPVGSSAVRLCLNERRPAGLLCSAPVAEGEPFAEASVYFPPNNSATPEPRH